MSDIRTTKEIIVGRYKVRFAKTTSGKQYEAVVIGHKRTPFEKSMGSMLGDESDYTTVHDAPIEDDPRKYVAIGKAIEEYIDMKNGGE